MIRILIAEDQALVRGALGALLGLEADFEVVGLAADGRQALALCTQLAPDIVLTDIEMPHMTGLELAVCLAEQGAPCRVVIVTTFGRSGYLRRALAAGVRGYLLKDAPADTLADAIRSVHGGGRAIAPELALELWGGGQDPCRSANARCCAWPGRAAAAPTSRARCICRKARCATICRKRSASWGRGIGSRRIGWRGMRGGCKGGAVACCANGVLHPRGLGEPTL